jgi:Raf kinase inhibitor-like YbhB/YbcL family protein
MKNASWTIKVLYSSVFISALGCSSAKPTAPVTRTKASAPATGNTTQNDDANASNNTTADAGTAPAVEDKPASTPPPPTTPAAPQPLALTSTAFANMGSIPLTHVATGAGGMNMSPPLQWKNAPTGTGFFAIQMVDLDFQNPPLIHWMISNIPATSTLLPAAIPGGNNLAAPAEALGANQMRNYGGPNPPNLHRYEWTIYAIKQGETLNLTNNSATNKTELEAKSLSKATLVGTFTP